MTRTGVCRDHTALTATPLDDYNAARMARTGA